LMPDLEGGEDTLVLIGTRHLSLEASRAFGGVDVE
jgi:hypothetical protein